MSVVSTRDRPAGQEQNREQKHLERVPGATHSIDYRYANHGLSGLTLWLAEPVDTLVQDQVCVDFRSQEPDAMEMVGENLVGRYRIKARQTLKLRWSFRSVTTQLVAGEDSLPTREAGQRYLRSSPLISQAREVAQEAQRIVGGASSDLEAARLLFAELVTNYDYRYPVLRRGDLAMQRSRKGDCGQFSSLLVGWCRSLGLPARDVNGTVNTGARWGAHAWAEIWLTGIGWVPTDAAFAQAKFRRNPSLVPGSLFADSTPERFGFSTDCDLPLDSFGHAVVPPTLWGVQSWLLLRFGAAHLAWGCQLSDGGIPYLQPAYPRSYRGLGPNFFIPLSAAGGWDVDEKRADAGQASGRLVGLILLCVALSLVLGAVAAFTTGSVAHATGLASRVAAGAGAACAVLVLRPLLRSLGSWRGAPVVLACAAFVLSMLLSR
ncbi:MAG: transglutaminase-like domain-containing protein [Chloroflexota bacterium]